MTNKHWGLKKGTRSLDEYLREFKGICDALVAIRKPVSNLDKVFQLQARHAVHSWKFFSFVYNMQDIY